jgi:hypothetical protein
MNARCNPISDKPAYYSLSEATWLGHANIQNTIILAFPYDDFNLYPYGFPAPTL